MAVLNFFKRSIFMTAAENICHRIKQRAFQIILAQEIEWFEENKPKTLSTTIFESTEKLSYNFGVTLAFIIKHIAQIIAGFYVAFHLNTQIAGYMLIGCGITSTAAYFIDKLSESVDEETYQKAARVFDQALGSIKTVQAHNGEKYELERFKEAVEYNAKCDVGHAVQSATLSFASLIGDVMSFRKSLVESQGLMKILELDSTTTSTTEKGNTQELHSLDRPARITFDNVCFSYAKRLEINVLKKVSFSCDPGQTVAIVGSSGAGKSTIVKLLQKFYEPTSGKISINGNSIKELEKRELRDMFGVVGQEPALFNTSILENVRFGKESATEVEVTLALQKANALDFVKSLPKGWSTKVGDRGCQLSGGQKQRIAIARAIIKNPKILLLDEATSALDGESEKEVLKALEKASKGRTTIVVAHRLSTIRKADKIVVLSKGEVVEVGSHEELMALEGHYSKLVRTQTNQFSVSKRRSTEEFSDHDFEDDEEIIFSEEDEEEKEDDMTRLKRECEEESVSNASFWEILKQVQADKWLFIVGVITCVYEGLSMPINRWIETNALESFSSLDPKAQLENGHWAALLMLLLIIPDMICSLLKQYTFEKTAVGVSTRLRIKLFSNLLMQNAPYFDNPKHSTGKLATRMASDAFLTRQVVSMRLSYLIRGLIGLIVGLLCGFYYCYPLALVTLPTIPFIAFLWSIWDLIEPESQVDKKLIEECGRLMSESIENIIVVQSLNLEGRMHQRYCGLLQKPHQNNSRKVFWSGVVNGLSEATYAVTLAVEYYLAGWYLKDNSYKPFDIFRAMVIMHSVGESLGYILSYFPEYRKSRLAAGLFFKHLKDTEVKEERSENTAKFGEVRFEGVHFTYPQRAEVEILRGLSFTVEPGQKVALVGGSGCGKSTVTSLLQRFYKLNDGQITLNGVELSKILRKELRSKIGLVSQEPVLFDETIQNNITYGIPPELISKEKVIEAAKSANIHSFIESLPDGYETIAGEKGAQLSGGQKQRVAIARALIRNPEFLILDEATSALDAESERVVQDALDQASFGRGCLVIAHRLSTIQNADKIVVIEKGKVVEQGTHGELLMLHGAYYHLVKHQNRI
ncbi:unnamed protein product, partial [Mesorhabditis belari]|uniref:Uncharacterized protein n=1 Tax=Mesorhabditis belari TaxID=2138241 RepID=A0AAF3FMG9_9BILA